MNKRAQFKIKNPLFFHFFILFIIKSVVLQSSFFFISNFGFTELTLHSEMKRKASFPFAFHSFFRNFAIRDGELTLSRHKKD